MGDDVGSLGARARNNEVGSDWLPFPDCRQEKVLARMNAERQNPSYFEIDIALGASLDGAHIHRNQGHATVAQIIRGEDRGELLVHGKERQRNEKRAASSDL